jgi:hypothetical protein
MPNRNGNVEARKLVSNVTTVLPAANMYPLVWKLPFLCVCTNEGLRIQTLRFSKLDTSGQSKILEIGVGKAWLVRDFCAVFEFEFSITGKC